MDNKNDNGHVMGCQCGMCGGGFHRYHLLRWLLGIFILVLVFALGVKLGELKGFMQANGYGEYGGRMPYRQMMNGNYFYQNGWLPPMMQQALPTATTTPKAK